MHPSSDLMTGIPISPKFYAKLYTKCSKQHLATIQWVVGLSPLMRCKSLIVVDLKHYTFLIPWFYDTYTCLICYTPR